MCFVDFFSKKKKDNRFINPKILRLHLVKNKVVTICGKK